MSDTHARYFGGLAADSYGTADGRPPLVLLHGLTYDRRHWAPLVRELTNIDPGRQVVAFDLPGHGESARLDGYGLDEVAGVLRHALADAELDAPILVGHSVGGALATRYAAAYPAAGVVNIDQPLLLGGFGAMLRQAEPVLRSADYDRIWDAFRETMQIELLPPAAQQLVRTATTPRQDLLLGYWDEILVSSDADFSERRRRELETVGARGVAYHYVTGRDPDPAYQAWLEGAVPDIAITVLPDSGHFPHLVHPVPLAGLLTG